MSNLAIPNKSGCKSVFLKILFVLSIISALFGLLILIIAIVGEMPQVAGFVTALILMLPFLFTLIVRINKRKRALGQFDKKSKSTVWFILIIIVVLVASLIFILIDGREYSVKFEPGEFLNGMNLEGSDFSGKDLSNVSFRNSDLRNVNFSNSNLSGVDFSGSELNGTAFTNAILSNNSFDSVDLRGSIDLSDQQLSNALNIPVEDLYAITAQKQILFEDRDQILHTLSAVCDQGIVEGAHQYDPEKTFHTMVVFDAAGEINNLTDTAKRNNWEPTAIRFTDLVACVGETEKVVIETCQYEEGLERSRVARIRIVRVIAAKTGEVLFNDDLYYQLPGECPLYMSEGHKDIRGWGPSEKQILEKLESFVNTGSD